MWYSLMLVRPDRVARRFLITLFAGALLAACGEDGAGPGEPPVVASVVVQPGQGTVYVGDELPFAVRALDAGGREITGRMVTWSSSAPAVATISEAGVVSALSAGTTDIRAVVDGVTGARALTVADAPVAAVTLDASDLHLWPGETRRIEAAAKDAAGRLLQGRTAVWSSANPAVVTVGPDGRVVAVGPGQGNVRVVIEGIAAEARITVSRRPVAAIAISPLTPVLTLGEGVQLRAVTKDATGQPLEDRIVEWSVDNGNATISDDGLLTAVREGYVTVTARSEGVAASMGATIIDDADYEYDLLYNRVTTAGGSELFVLTLGTGLAPLRLNAGSVSHAPTASPDGRRVAFAVSMRELGTGLPVDDIFVIDRIGGLNLRRLTDAAGIDDQPAWSPAGGKIAYRRAAGDGRFDIWVMNEDGSAPVNLTADMDAAAVRSAPAWTRDGTRIAYSQTHNGPAGTTASIWVMNADGSNKVQLTSTLTGFDASPTWSPDGSRIAFVRYYGAEADITILRLSDGGLTRIPLEGRQATPAWSPDGWLIAFGQNVRGIDELFTMRVNGTNVRLRTSDRSWGGGLAPAWIRRF